jgi:hypothetical protein
VIFPVEMDGRESMQIPIAMRKRTMHRYRNSYHISVARKGKLNERDINKPRMPINKLST